MKSENEYEASGVEAKPRLVRLVVDVELPFEVARSLLGEINAASRAHELNQPQKSAVGAVLS